MKQIIPINAIGGNISHAITAHYHKAGGSDFTPHERNHIPRLAILEIMEEPKPIQVAQIYDQKQNPMNGRVYSEDGIAPPLRTPTGGLSEPKIVEPLSCAMRGRSVDNPSDRTAGIPTEQRLEIGSEVANCLTSVQKDSMAVEPCILGYTRDDKGNVTSRHEKEVAGTLHTSTGSGGNTDQFVKEQVIGSIQANAMRGSIDGVSPCLTEAMGMGGGQIPMIVQNAHGFNKGGTYSEVAPTITSSAYQNNNHLMTTRYRIRKLTERECFRLQDVSDSDIDKIEAHRIKVTLKNGTVKEKPIPKSAKYKLAGNSIVVSCLYHIFHQMFIAEPPEPQPIQKSLFD